MGEVYRARDPRLGRDVAIKVLPDDLTQDRDRLRRFESEARAASALEHPNVLVVHDIGREGDRPYIVSEVLEGETLRARLGGSRLGVRKAVQYAKEIARGLAAAHEKGIVHRDLKPENLFLTRDDRVKILDFGLAVLRPPGDAAAGSDLETATATSPGVVLGTTGYMSPEQVRGEPVDHRSDIFSLGVVLYELVSGQRAFGAGSRADISAAILERDPPEISIAEATPALRAVLHRCLEKRPEDRFQSARDVAFALDIAEASERKATSPRWSPSTLATLAALGALCLGLAFLLLSRRDPPRRVRHLALTFDNAAPLDPAGNSYVPFALFPDGLRLVFGTSTDARHFAPLALRDLATGETTLLPGTEGATEPFVSPDGRWIGFHSSGSLKKLPVGGASPIALCEAANLAGGTGGRGDTVIFAPRGTGLLSVAGQGGVPEAFTTLAPGEQEHLWPQAIGDAVLFTVRRGSSPDDFSLAVQTPGAREHRVVHQGGSRGRYLPTGHLLYGRNGALSAVSFDPAALRVRGDPRLLVEKVLEWESGATQFDTAEDGTLVYQRALAPTKQSLVWVNRSGRRTPVALPPRPLRAPRLDASGRRVLFLEEAGEARQQDLWVHDLQGDTLNRLTFNGCSSFASWTPDGSAVTYVREEAERGFALYRQAIDGSTPARMLWSDRRVLFAGYWLPDAARIVFSMIVDGGDIFLSRPGTGAPPQLVVGGPGNQWGPRPSPDGRYVLYMSDETGRFEVYVASLVVPGQKRQITTDGGVEGTWSRDGKEIFFRSGRQLLAVPVEAGATFSAGKARVLFEGDYVLGPPGIANYDVSPDGGRFLMVEGAYAASTPSLVFVENWAFDLKRLVQTGR